MDSTDGPEKRYETIFVRFGQCLCFLIKLPKRWNGKRKTIMLKFNDWNMG